MTFTPSFGARKVGNGDPNVTEGTGMPRVPEEEIEGNIHRDSLRVLGSE